MFRKKDLSDEAILVLSMWRNEEAGIEWTALDAFRVWYRKITPDGNELASKEFVIKELKY